jgi:hypothetical protein
VVFDSAERLRRQRGATPGPTRQSLGGAQISCNGARKTIRQSYIEQRS